MTLLSLLLLGLQGLAFFCFLVLPDVILLRGRLFEGRRKKLVHSSIMLLALSLAIVATGPSAPAVCLTILLFLLSLVWHLSYAYFGDVLRPESILLLVKPDHFPDAAEAAFKDIRRLLPVFLVVGASAAAALLVLILPGPLNPFPLWSGVVAVVLLIFTAARVVFFSREVGVYPTIVMPAPIGTIHAAVLAVKWAALARRATGAKQFGSVSYSFEPVSSPKLTVAVIMGESIAPLRMSIFGGAPGTTPNLERRAHEKGPFRLFVRHGFAAGVASNSSVPGFLTANPFPASAPGSRTLFELAKQQDFATCYYSAQRRSPLDVAGSVGAVDRVETQESQPSMYDSRRDWMLADLVEATPPGGREFFFLYQRVNHTPYYNHHLGDEQPFHAFPRNHREVIENYDLGLRTYDENIDALLSAFEKRNEAVFVFITADHNEFLGENGLWGHNTSGSADGALVPMMLFTNRPEHAIAASFQAADALDAFSMVRMVLQTMGVTPVVDGLAPGTFYINNALPFGRAGYMTVRRAAKEGAYDVVQHDRTGAPTERRQIVVRVPLNVAYD